MRRVASINRTAGRGILSAASGRKPRIPVVRLFVTRERERERERERKHKSQHHIKRNHAGEKEDEEIQNNSRENRIKHTPIVFTSKHIVKDSSNIECSSFTREKDAFVPSSVSIFVVISVLG